MKDINTKFFKEKKEWSKVKDSLLGCYLIPYFQKIVWTGKYIVYIDCFAGKGKFEDGEVGSPLIALECISKIKMRSCQQIRAIFIEKLHYKELVNNVNDYKGTCVANCIEGTFEDNINHLLTVNQESNIFLYIDPYGISCLDMNIFQHAMKNKHQSIEILLNFNSFGFFREACRVMTVSCENDEAFKGIEEFINEYRSKSNSSKLSSSDLLTSIAGGTYWIDIVNQYKNNKIDGYEAEAQLSSLYKKQLQQFFRYVLDIPIRLKDGNRPKYRMIHACNHQDGCCLMAENMLKREGELYEATEGQGQLLLTGFERKAEFGIVSSDNGLRYINDFLKKQTGSIRYKVLLATFYSTHGIVCRAKLFQEELMKLEASGLVTISRNPQFTKAKKKSLFWEEAKDKTITIHFNYNGKA